MIRQDVLTELARLCRPEGRGFSHQQTRDGWRNGVRAGPARAGRTCLKGLSLSTIDEMGDKRPHPDAPPPPWSERCAAMGSIARWYPGASRFHRALLQAMMRVRRHRANRLVIRRRSPVRNRRGAVVGLEAIFATLIELRIKHGLGSRKRLLSARGQCLAMLGKRESARLPCQTLRGRCGARAGRPWRPVPPCSICMDMRRKISTRWPSEQDFRSRQWYLILN